MGKINVLCKQLAELIAAGEVVERPSSVIKELIENSIDAGATLITVEIQRGGITYIRVSDNGSGIDSEDIPLVFLRHATSKIKNQDDLDAIATLGFRGEAMASIAAVSKVELITRTANDEDGIMFSIHGGEEQECHPVGCPVGTTLIARDLFYNTPARMKFLKKDVAEANAVAVVVEKAALANPSISFKFIRDGQVKLITPGDGKLFSVIHAVFGKDVASTMIPVNYESFGMKVTGYISKPTESRSNRTMQNFFINNRFVRSKTMMSALEEAYRHSIMVGKFPSCVLNLQAPFESTDVNVHPAKIEVRFADETSVFNVIFYAVKSALQQYDYSLNLKKEISDTQNATPQRVSVEEYHKLVSNQDGTPNVSQEKKNNYTENIHLSNKPSSLDDIISNIHTNLINNETLISKSTPTVNKISEELKTEENLDLNIRAENWKEELPSCMTGEVKEVSSDNDSQTETEQTLDEKFSNDTEIQNPILNLSEENHSYSNARIIGELFGTYILLENNEQLILIDKHAAHERLIFEELKKLDLTQDRQILLAPVLVHLSREDYSAVADNMQIFNKIGFEVENFDGGDILVREVPISLPECDIRSIVEETAHKILKNHLDLTPEIVDDLLHNIACRSAIKAHDKNTVLELEKIVKMLRENEDVKYCPHGRPIARLLSKREIEKMFGRIQ